MQNCASPWSSDKVFHYSVSGHTVGIISQFKLLLLFLLFCFVLIVAVVAL